MEGQIVRVYYDPVTGLDVSINYSPHRITDSMSDPTGRIDCGVKLSNCSICIYRFTYL